jgi:hypothetical protein
MIALVKAFLILLLTTITAGNLYARLDPKDQATVEDKWIHYLVLLMAVQALFIAFVI